MQYGTGRRVSHTAAQHIAELASDDVVVCQRPYLPIRQTSFTQLSITVRDATPHNRPPPSPASSHLTPTKEKVNAFARVRLSVCLSVSKITQKRVHGFG